MKNISIFSLLLLLLFSSCRKDKNEVLVTPDPYVPAIEEYTPEVQNIVGDITGFIISEDGTPVPDAIVIMNNEITTTDAYGHFFLKNKTMNAKGTLVKVTKEGYFNGSRRFFPKDSENNRVKIQLLTKSYDATFNSADGGLLNMANGASVDFSPNSIRTEDGNLYNGSVNVAAKWLDPSQIETLDQMPGNLQGLNAEVELQALSTYGMIAVELQGANGEALNIANGKTAEITMPVPASLLNGAPAQIPLWSYNETHGLWVEEGTATLQNGSYVGAVSHFSFWNCDIPNDYVNLDLTVTDNNGTPLSNYLVAISLNSMPMSTGYGYTDSNGNVSGLIPANELLTLNIIHGICNEILYTQQIGPFSADADLDITVTMSTVNSSTITGTLVDCDNNPVTNGLIKIEFDGQILYHYLTEAAFTYSFTTCGTTTDFEVTGIDLDELVEGTAVTAPSNMTTDLGNLSACGNTLSNFMTITVDGVPKTYPTPAAAVDSTQGFINIQVVGLPNNDFIIFQLTGITAGDYSISHFMEGLFDMEMGWEFIGASNAFTTFIVTELTTDKIVGYANGMLTNTNGDMQYVEITFDILL